MAGFLDTLFGGGAEQDAANANKALLGQYQTTGLGQLATGYNTGQTNLNSAIGAYTPLANLGTQYSSAGGMLGNALGINGPGGNNIAAGAFQNNPGYTGAINAGLDIINRRRAAQGMNDSGNADIDAQTFGQNLQNQQYGSWLQNLQNMAGMGLTATSGAAQGQAGGYTNLANLAQQYAGAQTGLEGSVTTGMENANNAAAAGKAAGAKNLLNAGLQIAGMVATGGLSGIGSALGGAALSSGLGSALGGAYGGSAAQPLPGLTAADYGVGTQAAGPLAQWGLA
jgi:hypothetical protein